VTKKNPPGRPSVFGATETKSIRLEAWRWEWLREKYGGYAEAIRTLMDEERERTQENDSQDVEQ
jgi:hypothetical protein